MLSPGDLGFLRSAIFTQLDQRPQPLPVPDPHPQRVWLEWLGLPMSAGPLPSIQVEPMELDARSVQAEGILPEVVYGCLVQTWWHPGQSDWVARTRSEIFACYSAAELDRPGWPLTLAALKNINAYRLQELTPGELLEASRPFWQGHCSEVERMEGWLLLHLESFRRLQDVADCLFPFFQNQAAPNLDAHNVRQYLRIPNGLEWNEAVQILGQERITRLGIL